MTLFLLSGSLSWVKLTTNPLTSPRYDCTGNVNFMRPVNVPFRYGPTKFLHMIPQSPISDDGSPQMCARRRMPARACQPFESHRNNDEHRTIFSYLKLPSEAITRVKGIMHRKKSPQRRREWIIRTYN